MPSHYFPQNFLTRLHHLCSILGTIAIVMAVSCLVPTVAHATTSSCPDWKTQYARYTDTSHPKMITARHRGAFDAVLPENSLGAFVASFEQCHPAVETDVRMTVDSHLVLFHDTHIGKMLETSYDPEQNKGANPKLSTLTLEYLKRKHLLTPARTETHFTVPTLDELIDEVVARNPGSLIHLEVKESRALIPTLRLLYKKSKASPQQQLLKRFVVKFTMNEYPTPEDFTAMLKREGIEENYLLLPKINPSVAKQIDSMPELPKIPGLNLSANSSRAVAHWAKSPATLAPAIEINIKDSSEFLATEHVSGSRFGAYEQPTSLDLTNAKPTSVAEFAALVHHFGKRLAAFVPVPDFVMFTAGPAGGYTVPNTFGDKVPLDVVDAFYNNDSSCCYRIDDRRSASAYAQEKHDWRANLDWMRALGISFITADDTDSVEMFWSEFEELDTTARPKVVEPSRSMNSALFYAIRDLRPPDTAHVLIKGWNGGASATWGGEVCLWSNPGSYLWTVKCSHNDPPYSPELVIESTGHGKMRIRDPRSLECIYSDPNSWDRIKWSSDCDSDRAHWTRTAAHRFVDVDNREIDFEWDDRYSYGVPFAYNYFSQGDTSNWSIWKLVPVK